MRGKQFTYTCITVKDVDEVASVQVVDRSLSVDLEGV